MKKLIVFGIMLSLLTVSAENLIRNGKLTEGVRGWTFGSWTKTPGTREVKKEGDMYYLSLSNTKDNKFATLCVQQLKLKPDTTYLFKFRMRTKDVKRQLPNKVTHGAGVSFTAGRYLFAGAAQMWHMIEGTTGWTEYRGTFNTGKLKPNQYVSFYPSLTLATGTVDFTDFSLEEVKASAPAAAEKKRNRVNLFPVEFQNGRYHIARNFTATWDCTFTGKRPSAPVKVVFELPAGFEISGGAATRAANDKGKLWKWSQEKPAVKKLANGMTRYTLTMPPHVMKDWGAWNNTYRVFVKAAGKAGTAGTGRWYADGNEAQPLNLKILPPLDFSGKKPEKFIICPTFVPNLVGAPQEMSDLHLKLWRSLSKPQIISIDPWAWRHVDTQEMENKIKGFQKAMEIGSSGSMIRLGFGRWQQKDPVARKTKFPLCVPRSPREPNETLCPDYIIRDPQGLIWDNYVPTLLKERAGGHKMDIIEFDYEPHPNRQCFCAVCLKEFAKFSKITKKLDREQILSRYAGIWFKFRIEQHRQIIKRYYDACRKHFPGSKVTLVTDILHPTGSLISDWCAVDCRLSDNIGLDFMRNMPYFEGVNYYDTTAFNIKQLKTPWFPFIDPTETSRRFYIRYTPKGVKLNVVATAMLGSLGIGFWPNDFFDGEYLHELLRASRIVGAAEKFYFNGKRCDDKITFKPQNTVQRKLSDDGENFIMQTPEFAPHLRHTVHALGDDLLLTVINYHPDEDVILELSSADAQKVPAALANCSVPERTKNGKYLVKIKAQGAGIWVFSAKNKTAGAGRITAELQKFLKDSSGKKGGKDNLDHGLLRPEKLAMLKLTGKNRSIYINPNDQAMIMGWRSAASALNDVLNLRQNRGHMANLVVPFLKGREKFDAARKGNGLEFTYTVPAPEDANPEAEKYTGVKIVKNISLADNGSTVICKWEIINSSASGNALEFFARVRNIPMAGTLIPEGKMPGAMATVTSGKLSSHPGSPVSTLWHKKGAKLEFRNAKLENWNGRKVRFSVSAFGEEEAMEFSVDDSCYGIHLWRESEGIMTVEPMYHFQIPHGKKAVISQSVKYLGVQKAKKKDGKVTDAFTGIVFEDKNADGKQDTDEKGLAGIRVSDGLNIVKTANDGSFKLPRRSDARFVFASRPAGYKCSTKFYAPADEETFSFGFQPVGRRPLIFYHVTDTEARGPEKWLDEIKVLGAKAKGDFLLHTGDISGIPVHAEKMPLCGMDVFAVPGNHDMERTGTDHTREAYEKHLGPVYYSFDAGNLRFYALTYDRNLTDPAAQLQWLKNELALLPKGMKYAVIRHEPPMYGGKTMDLLLGKYHSANVGFICGHTHSHLVRRHLGVPVWESVSTPAGGLDHSPRAFRVFKETKKGLSSSTVVSNPLKIKGKVVSVNASAPAVKLAGPFAMPGKDAARNALVSGIKAPLALKWKAETQGVIHHAPPVICGKKVFAAASDDDNAVNTAVFAFDAFSGKRLWKTRIGAAVKGGLAADSNNIYACGADGLVSALRQKDGKLVWQTQIAHVEKTNGMYGSPTLYKGKLYFYNEAPIIIDSQSGKILYQGPATRETGGVWHGGVTVAGNVGVSGVSWRYGLKGFDLQTGKILWKLAQGRDFTYLDASPVFCDGKIYFKARKKLFIIDPASGKILKEAAKPAGMETPSAPVVTEKLLVFGSPDGLHAYSRDTLKKVWSFKPGRSLVPATAYHRSGNEVAASPVVSGKTVLCGALDGKLYLLDLDSGKKLQEIQLDSQIMAQTAVSGNAAAAVTMNGNVYMFTTK